MRTESADAGDAVAHPADFMRDAAEGSPPQLSSRSRYDIDDGSALAARRVLHVINGEYYSGAERVQDLLALRLPAFGYQVEFVCLRPGLFPQARAAAETPLVAPPGVWRNASAARKSRCCTPTRRGLR